MKHKKPLWGLLVVVLLIVGAYAAAQMYQYFPSTGPNDETLTETTFEKILNKLASGDVNTEKLDGISASGYLQSGNCSGTQVIKGINADGTVNCGDRANMLVKIKLIE